MISKFTMHFLYKKEKLNYNKSRYYIVQFEFTMLKYPHEHLVKFSGVRKEMGWPWVKEGSIPKISFLGYM